MNFKNIPFGNFLVGRTKVKATCRTSLHYRLHNAPLTQILITVVEDRVRYLVEDTFQKLRKSPLWSDTQIQILSRQIYSPAQTQPSKRGCLGEYFTRLYSNMTNEEKCTLADICGEYDDIVEEYDVKLRAYIRKVAWEQGLAPDRHDAFIDVVMCEIISNMAYHIYLDEISHTPKDIEYYFCDIPFNAAPFETAYMMFDKMAFLISRKRIDFARNDEYIDYLDNFISSMSNVDRLKQVQTQLQTKTN